MTDNAFPPATLTIQAWPDELIDKLGFEAHSSYCEFLWLPRIGPSATWAYRRLVGGLAASPDGYRLSLGELAHALGLGTGTGHHSPVSRTVNRLVDFELAARFGDAGLVVRRKVPPLTQRQLARLSPQLQEVHHRLLARRQAQVGAG